MTTIAEGLNNEFKEWFNSLEKDKIDEFKKLVKKADDNIGQSNIDNKPCGCWSSGMEYGSCIIHAMDEVLI